MKRILVIDDEERLGIVIQACLENLAGWQALLASSGQEGLQMAKNQQPDAILLDVMMPDMDGLTVLNRLQADPTTQIIPVILLTAKPHSTTQEEFAHLSIAGIITKPFDPFSLVNQVTQALGW